jgi:hypothetical protein
MKLHWQVIEEQETGIQKRTHPTLRAAPEAATATRATNEDILLVFDLL